MLRVISYILCMPRVISFTFTVYQVLGVSVSLINRVQQIQTTQIYLSYYPLRIQMKYLGHQIKKSRTEYKNARIKKFSNIGLHDLIVNVYLKLQRLFYVLFKKKTLTTKDSAERSFLLSQKKQNLIPPPPSPRTTMCQIRLQSLAVRACFVD